MTHEEIVAYLENEAPVPTDPDDFWSVAAAVASHLFPRVRWREMPNVADKMRRAWLPRLGATDDAMAQQLRKIVDVTLSEYQHEYTAKVAREAKKHEDAAAERKDRSKQARRIAERRAAEAAKKDSKAEQAKRIHDLLGCDRSHCYRIIDNGTTNQVQQARLAKEFGNQPSDWECKEKRRASTPLSNLLDKRNVKNCSLWDYQRSDPKLKGDAGKLKSALDDAYMSGRLIEPHYGSFDHFQKDVRSIGFAIEAADEYWYHYKLWRAKELWRVLVEEIGEYSFG